MILRLVRVGALVIALQAASHPVNAATYLWVGGASGDWSNGVNWRNIADTSTGVVPGVADTALFDSAGSQGVTLDISPAIDTLKLGPTLNQKVIFTNPGGRTMTLKASSTQGGDLIVQTPVQQDLSPLSSLAVDDIGISNVGINLLLPATVLTREMINPGSNGRVEFLGPLTPAASGFKQFNFHSPNNSRVILNGFTPGSQRIFFGGNLEFNASFVATGSDIRLVQSAIDTSMSFNPGVTAEFSQPVRLMGSRSSFATVKIRSLGAGTSVFLGDYQFGWDADGDDDDNVGAYTVVLEAVDPESTLIMDGRLVNGPSSTVSPSLVSAGAGTVRLRGQGRGANTFNRGLTIQSGHLQLDRLSGETAIPAGGDVVILSGTLEWLQDHQVADSVRIVASGGTLAFNGHDEVIGSLDLNGSVVLDLGSGDGVVDIGDSSALDWSDGSLAIINYDNADTVRLAGLTPAQMALVTVNGSPATFDTAGNILPSLVTPEQYVQLPSVQKPLFKSGHSLPRLSTFWPTPSGAAFNKILAEDWGYDLHGDPQYVSSDFKTKFYDNPAKKTKEIIDLHLSDPERYPLSFSISKEYTAGNSYENEVEDDAYLKDVTGALILNSSNKRIWSPACPQFIYDRMAGLRVAGLDSLYDLGVRHIEVLKNSGEYGFSASGWEFTAMRDPKVWKLRGSEPWTDFATAQVARQHSTMFHAINQYMADSDGDGRFVDSGLFVFYGASSPRDRGGRGLTDQGNYGDSFGYYGETFSDVPSAEIYYRHGWGMGGFESGTGASNGFGSWDMLTTMLNTVGQNIAYGYPLSYDWLSSGTDAGNNRWTRPTRYMGWLKCLYTLGMLGAVEQFYGSAAEFNAQNPSEAFYANDVPNWIQAMLVHSHTQALFSHLEEFLFDGDLLPGDDAHTFSADLPAYEYTTQNPNVRVLARKLRNQEKWLVTAWLASDTAEDTVLSTYENVTLPQIGILRVQARTCGTVYMIRNNAGLYEWKQMDVDVLHPSRSIPDDTAYETVDRALVPPPAWDGIIPVVAIDAIGTSVSEGALTGAGNILQPPAYSAASNTFKPWAVVLSQPTNRPITVKLTVLPASTASQGVDYVMPSNTFVIPPGRKEFRIGQLSLIQDSLKEGRERIEVQLEAVTGCTLGSLVNGAVSANGTNFTARCDIEDDDKPMIMVTKAADPATESGTIAKFKITVAPIVAQDTPVSFTMSGTATPTLNGTQVITGPNGEVSFASSNGADYFLLTSPYDTTVPPQTSVVIPAGQRTAEVSVIPTRDALAGEGAETITMTIDRTDPTNYDYRYSQSATVTITEP